MSLGQLEQVLDEFWLKPPPAASQVHDVSGRVYRGEMLLALMQKSGFSNANAQAYGSLIDRMGIFWMKRGL